MPEPTTHSPSNPESALVGRGGGGGNEGGGGAQVFETPADSFAVLRSLPMNALRGLGCTRNNAPSRPFVANAPSVSDSSAMRARLLALTRCKSISTQAARSRISDACVAGMSAISNTNLGCAVGINCMETAPHSMSSGGSRRCFEVKTSSVLAGGGFDRPNPSCRPASSPHPPCVQGAIDVCNRNVVAVGKPSGKGTSPFRRASRNCARTPLQSIYFRHRLTS